MSAQVHVYMTHTHSRLFTEFECISFPGPGVTNPMSENPFFEFVGAEGYSSDHQSRRVDEEFDHFKRKHKRKYAHQADEAERKAHFRHNYRSVLG